MFKISKNIKNKRKRYSVIHIIHIEWLINTYIILLERYLTEHLNNKKQLNEYLTYRITGLSPKISNYQQRGTARFRFLQKDKSFPPFLQNNESNVRETRRVKKTIEGNHFFKKHRSSSKSPVRSTSWIRLVHHQHFR